MYFLVLLAKFGLFTSLIIRDLGILITPNENVMEILVLHICIYI